MPKQNPLTPTVFHILLALADDDRHGYAIIQEVAAHTGGEVQIAPGTLYGAIKRLLEAELIAETAERPAPEWDDERRRYYRLTTAGRQVLTAEAHRLARLVQVAQTKRVLT